MIDFPASELNDEAKYVYENDCDGWMKKTHVKRFVHKTFSTLTNIHGKHKFQMCV